MPHDQRHRDHDVPQPWAALGPVQIPARVRGRRRDRRGRGTRGPLLAPGTPAQRTRAELFDEEVLGVVEHLERRWAKELRGVEFGIEDVPPSDPAPWEHEVALGRCFAADRVAGLPARVVIYRRPVEARAEGRQALRDLLREVIVEHVAELLGRPPEIIDP